MSNVMSVITANMQMERMIEISVRLALALICGGLLGIERGLKKRPAGFRTYMLVCLGATLVMMTNQYVCEIYQTGDPSRLGAQVVSGIGFLGAGTIITTRHNRVTGLTTAAGLWAVACIGLALGIGFYEGAIIGTVLIFFAMSLMQTIDARILTSAKYVLVYVEFDQMTSLKHLLAMLKEKSIRIIEFETENSGYDYVDKNGLTAILTLRLPSKKIHARLLEMISSVEGVAYAEEL